MSRAKAAEYAMHDICNEFKQWDKNPKEIIEIVNKHNSKRLNIVEEYLYEQGYENIHQANTKILADHALGLDEVFQLKLKFGKLLTVGLGITINPCEIITKPKKLQKMKPMLKELGIDLTIVVLWMVPLPPSCWSKEDKKLIKNKILNQIKMMLSTKQWVTDITIII